MAMLFFNMSKMTTKHSLNGDLPCTRSQRSQRRCRNMVRSPAVANARSGFGLLLVQTEHPEQRRRVKQDKQRDVECRTCRDMAREDHKGRRLRKIAEQGRHCSGGQCDGDEMIERQRQTKSRKADCGT